MNRERFAVGFVVVVLMFAVAFFGFTVYTEQQRAAQFQDVAPPPVADRYERLIHPTGSPVDDREVVDSPEVSEPTKDAAFDRETITRYKAQFAAFEESVDADVWRELYMQLRDRGADRLSPEQIRDLRLLIADHEQLLEDIRQLAKRGGPAYPINFDNNIKTILPHLSPMREFARMLAASAAIRARDGDYEAAVRDIIAGMQLADALAQEPVLVSQLVRWAMYNEVMRPLQRDMPPGQLPPHLVEEIAQHAARAGDRQPLVQSMQGEQYFVYEFFNETEQANWPDYGQIFAGDGLATRAARFAYESPIMQPFRNLDAASYSRLSAQLVESMRLPYYEARPLLESIRNDVDSLARYNVATRAFVPAILRINEAHARFEAQIDLLQIGLAVESRYHDSGTYPESLDELSIGVLTDPHTGRPYHYQSTGDTFTIYSIGVNTVDDGGRHDFRDGDIVWRGEEPTEKSGPVQVARSGSSTQ